MEAAQIIIFEKLPYSDCYKRQDFGRFAEAVRAIASGRFQNDFVIALPIGDENYLLSPRSIPDSDPVPLVADVAEEPL